MSLSAMQRRISGDWFAYATLGVCSALIVLLRLRYFHEPLDNDIPVRIAYAVRALGGADYYTDLRVFGPPGALWTSELFVLLFGSTALAVYAMGCTFALITLFGIWACSRTLLSGTDMPSRIAGAIACVAWIVLSGDLQMQANQPNGESLMNAALVWGLYFTLRRDDRNGLRNGIIAGLLFFAASTVKHFIVLIPAFAFVGGLIGHTLVKNDSSTARAFWRPWLAAGVAGALAWVVVFLGFQLTGRGEVFLAAMTSDSLRYATETTQAPFITNFWRALQPSVFAPWHLEPFLPLFFFTLVAIVVGTVKRKDSRWLLIAGWCVGAWAAVAAPGKFFPHYYQLWQPVLAIGAGVFFGLVWPRDSRLVARAFALTVVAFVGLAALRLAHHYVSYDPVRAAQFKGGTLGDVYAETQAVGTRLKCVAGPHPNVYEVGAHAVYFYADAMPPDPFVDSIYISTHAHDYLESLPGYLQREKPTYLILRRDIAELAADDPFKRAADIAVASDTYVEIPDLSSPNLRVLRRSSAAPENATASSLGCESPLLQHGE